LIDDDHRRRSAIFIRLSNAADGPVYVFDFSITFRQPKELVLNAVSAKANSGQLKIVSVKPFTHLDDVIYGQVATLCITRTGGSPNAGAIRANLLGEEKSIFGSIVRAKPNLHRSRPCSNNHITWITISMVFTVQANLHRRE
jgi:hypothetical protein